LTNFNSCNYCICTFFYDAFAYLPIMVYFLIDNSWVLAVYLFGKALKQANYATYLFKLSHVFNENVTF